MSTLETGIELVKASEDSLESFRGASHIRSPN